MSAGDASPREQTETVQVRSSNDHQHSPTRKREEIVHRFSGTGMTPSIITTINNTNPTPLMNSSSTSNNNNNNNNNGNATSINPARNIRRPSEPYESYIEDSFVGHWELEDDGYEHHEEFDAESQDGCDQDKSDLQHPSTIEFDFDSFGPESIIFAPATNQQQASNNKTLSATAPTTATTRPPPLMEVSREAEKAHEDGAASNQNNMIPSLHEQQPEPNRTSEQEDETSSSPDHVPSDALHRNRAMNLCPTEHLVDLAKVDLKVIEPYKKVISHAGYCHHYDPSAPGPKPGEPAPAVIVFSACYLPDRSRRDYNYVMDHLFLYVLSSLHELIADDYILIYLHNTQPASPSYAQASSGMSQSSNSSSAGASTGSHAVPNNLPTFSWMKRCYQMIDRKLRKNLKILYLVKPTFWLKTIVIMCKPFISTKFSKKLRFVEDMNALRKCMPVDKLILPASAENS